MKMIELLNVIAAILALTASGYLFVLAFKAVGELRTGLLLMAFGVVVAMGIHSIAELLEVYQLIRIEVLTKIMPVLVTLGSLLLLVGVYFLYKIVIHSEVGK